MIKNKEDLNFYSNLKDSSFPLNRLDNEQKNKFINSLTFNEKGLTGFDYSVFENLSTDETFKILSLFGAGHISGQIKEDQTYELELNFMKNGQVTKKDYKDYRCESRATCVTDNDRICMSSC